MIAQLSFREESILCQALYRALLQIDQELKLSTTSDHNRTVLIMLRRDVKTLAVKLNQIIE